MHSPTSSCVSQLNRVVPGLLVASCTKLLPTHVDRSNFWGKIVTNQTRYSSHLKSQLSKSTAERRIPSAVIRSTPRLSAVAAPVIEVEQLPASDDPSSAGPPSPQILQRRPQEAKDEVPPNLFTYAEVATHSTEEDCWLIIAGKVYDVTPWVKKHPGGSIIIVNAGKDCTQMFETYHPMRVRGMLRGYCIGSIDPSESNSRVGTPVLGYKEEDSTTDFYPTLKARVEAYFRDNKLDPRVHPHMFIKTAAILGGYWACYYLTFFVGDIIPLSVVGALGMGVLTAQVGASIMHDANHGALGNSNRLSFALGATLDMVGSSSFLWRQQHVVGHHMTTNVNHFDPDIRVEDPDVRRLTVEQPIQWYHAYQHVYMAALYSLLTIKGIFFDDFHSVFSRKIGPIEVPRMNSMEKAVFWGGKLSYVVYMLALPLFLGAHTATTSASLYLLSQLVAGWTLSLMFQVAHVVEKVEFPVANQEGEGGGGRVSVAKGWAAAQVATTADFSHDSWFWTHFSGGLNHQVEHHLFPGICHVYYPHLQPIVKATCEEFGVQYHSYPDAMSALKAHFAYIKKVGVTADFRLGG